jgi:hypothetical protein
MSSRACRGTAPYRAITAKRRRTSPSIVEGGDNDARRREVSSLACEMRAVPRQARDDTGAKLRYAAVCAAFTPSAYALRYAGPHCHPELVEGQLLSSDINDHRAVRPGASSRAVTTMRVGARCLRLACEMRAVPRQARDDKGRAALFHCGTVLPFRRRCLLRLRPANGSVACGNGWRGRARVR